MRTIFLSLLLLASPLSAQVKILLPVVVRDVAGKPITDLKMSDFQVSGPKDLVLADMSLLDPQTAGKDDARPSVVVIYDAANIPTSSFELNIQDLRGFLHEVADHKMAVTLLVNAKEGLRLIYNARTPPEVLAAALAATSGQKTKGVETTPPADPRVEQQIKNLQLLSTAVPVPRSRLEAGVDQMNSLLAMAHLVRQLPGRKGVLWITMTSPVEATELPAYWGTTIHADRSLLPMYEATVEELNAAHVSVYPLFFTGANPENYGYLWDSWMGMKQLATSTGGLAFKLGEQASIFGASQTMMNDLAPYYMLVTEVPTPKELDWIPVKVKVKQAGLTVRAAPGFLGLKPVKTK